MKKIIYSLLAMSVSVLMLTSCSTTMLNKMSISTVEVDGGRENER